MNKHLSSRTSPLVASALIVGAILVVFLGAYGLTRAFSRDEVMGRVEVSGTPLGGQDRDQALATVLVVEDSYATRPAVFDVGGKFVSLDPPEVGFGLDEEEIVDEAMAIGREGNPIDQFVWWLTHIFDTVEVPLQGSIQPEAVNEVFDVWDNEVISSPSRPGGIRLEDDLIVADYPQAGTGVDREAATPIVTSALLAPEAQQREVPTTLIEPKLTRAEVDEAAANANLLLSSPIEMAYNGSSITFEVAQLLEAFRSETVSTESDAEIVMGFDPEVVDEYLTPVRGEFEAEPVNARHRIDGDTISIVPGQNGTRIDEELTAERLADAGMSDSRRGELPIVEDAEPDVTTEYLESLQINHLVSQFTTYHPCCAPRVTNIQAMADLVDGTIVLPGRTFSLNGHTGERTEEKGFLPAPTIIAGQLEDTVGGGVSQFATTIYNAIFWGGYEDIEHKPHSYYFTRYPEGIEATVNWRTPDLQFRNNRSHAVLIDTLYTDTSITVRFFGENDGRTLKGEQSGGSRKVWVHAEGGPDALHVKGSVSDRYAFTEPGSPQYVANPELGVDQQVQVQDEGGGWNVTVTRQIFRGGTDLVEEQEWVVRYLPKFAVYEVHPCKVPGTSVACPTTTTLPPSTTVPPSTTTPQPTTPPTTPPPTTPTTTTTP